MTESKQVFLVSCVSKKSLIAAPAREFYVSPWFMAVRRYVEASGDPWYVLSAKHGLVTPLQVLAPYDETLNKMKIVERRAWASRVTAQMDQLMPSVRSVVVLAWPRYREFLMDYLKRRWKIEVPLKGLGIGKQLQWLKNHSGHESTR
jgi:hypothetical protein